MPRFTIEARYECGQIQHRETYEAVSLIDALNRAAHCPAFLAGDTRYNRLRNDLMVSCDGGPLVLVGTALAAERMGMAA
jgi:hypothetical protein